LSYDGNRAHQPTTAVSDRGLSFDGAQTNQQPSCGLNCPSENGLTNQRLFTWIATLVWDDGQVDRSRDDRAARLLGVARALFHRARRSFRHADRCRPLRRGVWGRAHCGLYRDVRVVNAAELRVRALLHHVWTRDFDPYEIGDPRRLQQRQAVPAAHPDRRVHVTRL
jgi:hypothetical protein